MKRVVEKRSSVVPKQPKLTRVAAYARVSSGKDEMLHSLSAQISYYSGMIQKHTGWLYCGVYSDEAKTGTKAARPGFQRMLTDCRAGKLDLVITKSISRFARNTVTLLQTVRELKEIGIDVYFEEQNLHTIGPDGELIMTILAAYAQEESLSVSESPNRICFMIEENGETLLIAPYEKRDFRSHGVPPEVYTGTGGMEVSSIKLCRIIAEIYHWELDRSYRVPGTIYLEKKVAIFRLREAELIDRTETD